MDKIEKELLFKDLCARLPYGLNIQVKEGITLDAELKIGHINRLQNDDIELKPYLRPLSSMTDEEKKEWNYLYLPLPHKNEATETERRIDWLNEHHFDYRGLIEKGLALEATEGMYND